MHCTQQDTLTKAGVGEKYYAGHFFDTCFIFRFGRQFLGPEGQAEFHMYLVTHEFHNCGI